MKTMNKRMVICTALLGLISFVAQAEGTSGCQLDGTWRIERFFKENGARENRFPSIDVIKITDDGSEAELTWTYRENTGTLKGGGMGCTIWIGRSTYRFAQQGEGKTVIVSVEHTDGENRITSAGHTQPGDVMMTDAF
jgi:hypothetical protein